MEKGLFFQDNRASWRLRIGNRMQAEWGLRKAQNSNNGLIEAAHSVERGVLRENLHSTLNIEPSTFNAQPL